MEDNIIVIGSKPNTVIPKKCYSKIYTANGACERGAKLRFENKINLKWKKFIFIYNLYI